MGLSRILCIGPNNTDTAFPPTAFVTPGLHSCHNPFGLIPKAMNAFA